ncbi:MAG: sulfatase-like hydrolase/transferase [Bacilli bacterium]|nr:sulfatase-like hydrolase/transferase [Bacilli bacterium]
MKKKILYLILYIYLLFLSLVHYSSIWAIATFNFYSFDEVLFQLTTPIQSAASSILSSYVTSCLLIAVIVSILLFSFLVIILRFLSKEYIDFSFLKASFHLKSKVFKIVLFLFMICFSIFMFYSCADRMLIIDYIKNQANDSSFIEDYYVNPKDVSITFPENKRNLIYIYAESMESTFFSSDLGGGSEENYLSPLTDLTTQNVSFSDTELFGGALMVNGTSWTSGSMVANTSGLPLKNSFQDIWKEPSMLPKAITLGDILEENGYHQELMFGSDKDFGNRGLYFENHGHYQIYDYYTAIEKKKIDEDYYVWWGFEDSKLFAFAKEEILSLAREEEPFNFTMLTVNTHTVDGYVEDDCSCPFENSYENAIYCSSEQIADFIYWIQEQDFYPNTTVIIVGDHVSMQSNFYPDSTKRRTYNLFINSAVEPIYTSNRSFTTMDYFPTTLASLGAQIEGNRLGLGTNLFSDQKTITEEVGEEEFDQKISQYSSYYMKEFN